MTAMNNCPSPSIRNDFKNYDITYKLITLPFRTDKLSSRDWQSALDDCLKKAEELKYEVSRIRGKDLIKP